MGIFVIRADRGVFIGRGDSSKQLSEQTDYYIFASDKDAAKAVALLYVGDRIGHGSNIERNAIFDDVGGWIERAENNGHIKAIEFALEEAARLIGSIVIENSTVVRPEHTDDLLIVSLSEGGKRRTLLSKVSFSESGEVEWGEDLSSFDFVALAQAIQRLF
jgi:hypothetical protein